MMIQASEGPGGFLSRQVSTTNKKSCRLVGSLKTAVTEEWCVFVGGRRRGVLTTVTKHGYDGRTCTGNKILGGVYWGSNTLGIETYNAVATGVQLQDTTTREFSAASLQSATQLSRSSVCLSCSLDRRWCSRRDVMWG
jgi:hypothetical protein